SAAPTAPAAAPSHPGAAPSAAAPTTTGAPAPASGGPDLKLAAYDPRTGQAVLAVAPAAAGAGTPSAPAAASAASSAPAPASGTPGPSASAAASASTPASTPASAPAAASASAAATAAATSAVQPGRLIDSPPTAAAPQGALLAITGVAPAGAGKVAVTTRPATISELLGQTWADIKSALDPHKIKVTPKLKDLKASYVPAPDGGAGSASAALELDADDTVPIPGGGSATLAGSVELDPSVMFSYHGAHGILAADQAKVGFDLGAHANWHLTAALTGSTGQVKIPIATLTATPTVMVGELPVVITLNLTVYAEVSADGTVTVDTTQSLDGDWGVHADYTRGAGWTNSTEPVSTKVSPVKASFTGTADVRSGLVADGSVALYDSVGVKATVEPYLRAAVNGSATIDSSSGKPVVQGSAGLYGGLDVNGAVLARIAILGTPPLEKDLPFKLYQNEWPIVTESLNTKK
ncbi:hypothetical protein, partial [Kitasatospora sp. LaBMicrA B282]|uniref:hypothetical protein n=1 Tax=Kitasatospora sp. LaBMicrA B282 TaxID=3420949 RepID=UPI003D09FEB4